MQLTHWPGKRVCLCLVEVTTGRSRRQGAHGTVQCDVAIPAQHFKYQSFRHI